MGFCHYAYVLDSTYNTFNIRTAGQTYLGRFLKMNVTSSSNFKEDPFGLGLRLRIIDKRRSHSYFKNYKIVLKDFRPYSFWFDLLTFQAQKSKTEF